MKRVKDSSRLLSPTHSASLSYFLPISFLLLLLRFSTITPVYLNHWVQWRPLGPRAQLAPVFGDLWVYGGCCTLVVLPWIPWLCWPGEGQGLTLLWCPWVVVPWEWEEPRAPTLLKPPLARGHAESPGSAAGRGFALSPPTKAWLICGGAEVQTPHYHHGQWTWRHRNITETRYRERLWENTEGQRHERGGWRMERKDADEIYFFLLFIWI